MELVDSKRAKSRFFVRTRNGADTITAAFGEVEWIEAPGVTGEMGFLTGEMAQEEYEKRAEGLQNVLQMIRVV